MTKTGQIAKTVFLFSNSTNFAKVDTPKLIKLIKLGHNRKNKHMQKNIKISKIDKKGNKLLRVSKFLLKGLQMFYIFWTNVSK